MMKKYMLCYQDLFFSDGIKDFTRGKWYEVTYEYCDGCSIELINNRGQHHVVGTNTETCWGQYFAEYQPTNIEILLNQLTKSTRDLNQYLK